MSFEIDIPRNWRKVRLSELGEINRGKSRHRPRDAEHLYGGAYPFVQTGNIKASNGRITQFEQTYSEAGLAQSRLWPKDTMCITIAANIAETGILQFPACFPDSVIGFIADIKKCNVYFIEYMFRLLRRKIQKQATGSVQDNINIQTLESLYFPIPSLDEQNRIAKILCSFDDKIELNRQTNQTLEQIAQAMFKSWFVDFEPTRAKIFAKAAGATAQEIEQAAMRAISGKTQQALNQLPQTTQQTLKATANLFPETMEESELGEIPQGWEVKSFGEVSQCFDSKRIPLSKPQRENKKPGDYPYHGATSIMDYVNEWIFDGIYLLLGEDGSVAKEDGTPFIQYIWGKSWVNNHAHVLQGKDSVSTEQLMLFIQTQNIAAYITGAVQQKLNQGNMNSIPFIFADKYINEAFFQSIQPLYAQIRNLSEEIQKLTELRDSLLPKLLSGELSP